MDVANLDVRVNSTSVKAASANIAGMGAASKSAMSKVKLLSGALVAMGAGRVLSKVISDTNQFTKSISELSAITGATGKDLAFYEEQAAQIGKTTTLSASQAATAFKLIASAKPDLLQSKEALAAVTKEAVTLAEAAGVDLASAASTVGVSLNQFGAEADQASRFVNVLAAGAKEGSSSITDTSAAMKNAGVAAKLAGLSFEEANVGVQLLAKGGLFAAEAGTGFRQVLLKLENEAEDKFKPSIVGLAGALENLAAENMSLTELTGLFGAEAMKSAAVMISGAGDARTLEAAITGTSIASEMAATNFDNMEGDMLSLNSANEGLAITFGKMLEPAIRKSLQAATDFSRKVDDFVKSDKFDDFIKILTISLQTLSVILFTKVIVSLVSTSTAFLTTASSAGILKVGLSALGGPIGVTVAALFGLYKILENVFGIDYETYIVYFKAIAIVTGNALKEIKVKWDDFADLVSSKVQSLFKYLADLFAPLIDFYASAINTLVGFYSGLFNFISTNAKIAATNFVDVFKNAFMNVKNSIANLSTNISSFYATMKVKAQSLYDSEAVTAAKMKVINDKKLASINSISSAFEAQRLKQIDVKEETGFLSNVYTSFTTTVNNVGGAFKDFGTDIVNTATTLQNASANQIKSASDSIGVLKTEFHKTTENVNLLGKAITVNTGQDGSFRVVNGVMAALATNTGAVASAADTTATNIEAVGSSSSAATPAVTALTVEQQTFATAVVNTQTAFATLIKDTIISGKLDFKSFFSSVKEGWKTMVSEFASKKIMDIIFGEGGITGFLGSLSGGMNGIIATITNGAKSMFASITGSAVSGATGSTAASVATNAAGGATGGAAAGAAGGATLGGVVAGAGQFIAGMTGSATGIAAGTMGPPTAAAMAGSGVTAGLQAGGAKLLALATNPVTIAIAVAAVAAKLLDKSGTMSANAGMLTQNLAGVDASRKFAIPKFASGAQFYGFKRREEQSTASAVVDSFATLDSALTEAALAVGITPNLLAKNFTGSDERGRNFGKGAFLGSASEDGNNKSVSLQDQLDSYATQWINMVGSANGVDPSVIADVIGGGTAAGILNRTKPDGSLASGIERIPFDGFRAELHEGERVQSVAEVKRADLMASEMNSLRGNLNDLMLVVAKAVSKTARIESRWDINGLPPTRT